MQSQDIFILLKLASLERQDLHKDYLYNANVLASQIEDNYFLENRTGSKPREDEGHLLDMNQKDTITEEEYSNYKGLDQADTIEAKESWQGWDPSQGEHDSDSIDTPSEQGKNKYTVRELSSTLGISKTAINNSIRRSTSVGLIFQDRKTGVPRVYKKILLNFIIFGLKYVFPPVLSIMTRGIPTSFASPALKDHIKTAGELIYVWPDPLGKLMGQSVTPLYDSVPFAVRKDRILYEYLALVDAIRLGNAREVNLAKTHLEQGLLKK